MTSTNVTHDASGWSVVHHISNGDLFSRTSQYDVSDRSNANSTEWWGARRTNPAFTMDGVLFNENGRTFYDEEVFRNGAMVGHRTQDCGAAQPPYAVQPTARVGSPPPATTATDYNPTPATTGTVPFVNDGSQMWVNAVVDGRSLEMVIDTGATVPKIPTTFADQLIGEGHATEGDGMDVELADGQKQRVRTVNVDSVTVGAYTSSNVEITVSDSSNPLLGLSVLNVIGNFRFDGQHSLLTFS